MATAIGEILSGPSGGKTPFLALKLRHDCFLASG
jgi:hypothetical protein